MSKLINLINKKPFTIVCKNQIAEIDIYSSIGDSFWDDSVSAKSFSDELKKLDGKITDIHIRLNSPGGDVFDGLTIYNRLKQHKAKVTVYIDGLAASIASIIALAGDEVVMGEGALFMIHKPMSGVMGNSTEMLEMVDRLDLVEEQLVSIYNRKNGMDKNEIRNMLAGETWLNADEALEMGFIDRVMEQEETVNIAASADKAYWIKKMPKVTNHNQMIREKLNNVKKDVEGFLARPKT